MSENKKISVLVVPSDRGGVGLYRSVSPHAKLLQLYGDEFDVEFNYEPNWLDHESFDKYDIIHFHKGLIGNMEILWDALKYFKEHNIVTVMDIDDYWKLGPQHPMYLTSKATDMPGKITKNFGLVDYVTTTTEIFANKIKPFNKNVLVFPNAIEPSEEQYLPIKNPSKRIRFGFVMGSSHEKDMELFYDVVASLKKETLDKIQFVLCGYNLKGTITVMKPNGEVAERRDIKPMESVWYRYEKLVTDDYKIISPEYKEFLLGFHENTQWPNVENEPYRREWTMDVTEFAKHYRNVDVLLVPLAEHDFNLVKSELKFIEAGFTRTAVVCSNFGPYTIGSDSMFKYGGELNEDGNCVLIDNHKGKKAWVKAIEKLVANPELITLLQNNMYEHVKDDYDLNNVTAKRAEFYKKIVKK